MYIHTPSSNTHTPIHISKYSHILILILTQHSWVAAANGDVNKVPVMFGTNRDEGSVFCDLEYDATFDDLHTYWTAFGLDSAAIQTLTGVYLDGKTYVNMQGLCCMFRAVDSFLCSIVVMFHYYWCIRKL